ncbi:TRAP transporter small permease [Halovibrio sp. HP20-50]|uniref:TRAP transporter small permease subunit n=1 Tax=Halovibrio sp. HP20-59 TaxID=3080275 RepID=UPI00294B7FBD|nr:TRAP transporter small permease [Halovibrio sp. HP20-59]MEA2119618.1 TRAP transporter small permease [Halovibrio sp. HP20-59]
MATTTTHTPPARSGLIGGYIRTMDQLSRFSAYIACALFIAGVLAICHMVFTRYILGWSTSWQTEFTIFSVTGAMLMGSSYVLMTGGHVAITILPDAIGGLGRKIMLTIASLFGFAFCAALAYASWVYVLEALHGEWTTGSVWNPPLWPALLPVAVGATLLALQYVADMLRGEG